MAVMHRAARQAQPTGDGRCCSACTNSVNPTVSRLYAATGLGQSVRLRILSTTAAAVARISRLIGLCCSKRDSTACSVYSCASAHGQAMSRATPARVFLGNMIPAFFFTLVETRAHFTQAHQKDACWRGSSAALTTCGRAVGTDNELGSYTQSYESHCLYGRRGYFRVDDGNPLRGSGSPLLGTAVSSSSA